MALKSMSVAKLQELRSKVEAAIGEKVTTRRHELEVCTVEACRIFGRWTPGRNGAAWWSQRVRGAQVP